MTERSLSRRQFIQGAALWSAGFGRRSERRETDTFETDVARWVGLYEGHAIHESVVCPANIPATLDALSFEGMDLMSRGTTDSVLQAGLTGYDTSPCSSYALIPQDTLRYLRDHRIQVAVGDVAVDISGAPSDEQAIAIQRLREEAGFAIGIGGTATASASAFLPSLKKRRDFLFRTGEAAAILGGLTVLPPVVRYLAFEGLLRSIGATDYNGARAWSKIYSMNGLLMPELLNDLFRELIQSSKLMSLARHFGAVNGRQPFIGYNWHFAHCGIENWLRAGTNLTHAGILAFPDTVLRKVIEDNKNDPRSLYAMRLISPSDGSDCFIEDSELKQSLAARGLA